MEETMAMSVPNPRTKPLETASSGLVKVNVEEA
jgi:hypothetical protein